VVCVCVLCVCVWCVCVWCVCVYSLTDPSAVLVKSIYSQKIGVADLESF